MFSHTHELGQKYPNHQKELAECRRLAYPCNPQHVNAEMRMFQCQLSLVIVLDQLADVHQAELVLDLFLRRHRVAQLPIGIKKKCTTFHAPPTPCPTTVEAPPLTPAGTLCTGSSRYPQWASSPTPWSATHTGYGRPCSRSNLSALSSVDFHYARWIMTGCWPARHSSRPVSLKKHR